jgi:predicted dehydrogenase
MRSILVIGCGSIGERHLRCFQQTGRARPVACDANPALLETIGRTYGVATTTDWNAALTAHAIDTVVVCTPAHLHVPIATAALARGCHVLIEKPLSQSLAGVDELVRARDRAGKQVAVAYVLHAYPLLNQARDYLRSGQLGPVRQVVLSSGQHFPTGRPAHTVPYHQTYYRDRKTGGGAIQDALTHTVNWVESVIGPVDSVLCDCAHQALPLVEVEDTVHVSARHGDVLANYSLNQFQPPNESTLQFNTATGSLKIEFHHRRWGTLFLGETDWTWREVPPADRDAAFIAQASAFLDQLDGQPSRLCSLEAAIATLRFNLAALTSADSGARVRCADLKA